MLIVQWLAAKSLGKIGDIRALEPLIVALKAEDKWLRQGAAWDWGDYEIDGQLNRSLHLSAIRKEVSGETPHGLLATSETNELLMDSHDY